MKDNLSSYNSSDYDARVSSVLPFYTEFHEQIIDLAKTYFKGEINWLDTGCGTGSLAQKLQSSGLKINLTLCDPSDKMLDTAKQKLCSNTNINYLCAPSQELDFAEQFDIVTAVQSHHYLDKETRIKATKNCFNALKNGGIYITFENILMSNPTSDSVGMERWANYMRGYGKSEEEITSHQNRRGTEVFPITILEHLNILKNCGFKTADILWTSQMQSGFFAIK